MTDVPGDALNIAPTPAVPQAVAETPNRKKPDLGGFYWGTGRRKSSVARVRIKPGSGKLLINKKEIDEYFRRVQDRNAVVSPLKVVDAEKAFDIFINVRGGGHNGAIRGISIGNRPGLEKLRR